jgi:hypothetical protein
VVAGEVQVAGDWDEEGRKLTGRERNRGRE